MRFTCLAVLVIGVSAAATVHGQEIPTVPAPERPAAVRVQGATISELEAMSKDFTRGRWDDFVGKATALMAKVGAPVSPDLKRDYVLFVWADTVPTATEPVLLSAILHDPIGEPYAQVIPGLKRERRMQRDDRAQRQVRVQRDERARFYEVFMTDNRDASIASYYISKPLPDPLLAQVPAVVDKFLGPLFTTLDAAVGRDADVAFLADAPPVLYAFVREVELLEPRANVEVKMTVRLPGSADTAIRDLEGDVVRRGLASTTAQKEALTRAMAGMRDAEPGICRGTATTTPTCRQGLHQAVTNGLSPWLESAAYSQRAEIVMLATAIHAGIDAFGPTVASGSFSIENSPLTHFGFGLVSAFAPRIHTDGQRAVLDGNKIAAAGLPQALQMVVLNWSPWGFQQKTTRRWNRRGFARPFAGVVFSPDIGISVGMSFMVLSNLGLNLGYASLWSPMPEEGLQIGADLSEKLETGTFKYPVELQRDPLRAGQAGALFFGVSYNFN